MIAPDIKPSRPELSAGITVRLVQDAPYRALRTELIEHSECTNEERALGNRERAPLKSTESARTSKEHSSVKNTRVVDNFLAFKPGTQSRVSEMGFGNQDSGLNVTMTQREARKVKKRVQHRDFPGGHPSQYYSGPSALNCGVLMGSGALTLV